MSRCCAAQALPDAPKPGEHIKGSYNIKKEILIQKFMYVNRPLLLPFFIFAGCDKKKAVIAPIAD